MSKETFYDADNWQANFEEVLKGNPDLAHELAWLLHRIARELTEGKKGRKRVVNTMKLGVEWLYQFTDARKLSFQVFLLALEGRLTPSDKLEELLKGVIQRACLKADN
jgi:hypothetical protein